LQERTCLNGRLIQDADTVISNPANWQVPTTRKPSAQETEDLLFAEKIAKHLKSNSISLVKNRQLIGIGLGQTSRVDSLKHAIRKAEERGFNPMGAVMASDGFFPFSDCVELANEYGITAVIQPGGSKNDAESVNYAEAHQMTMVLTGIRHFRH
jgi:phosphoribosylaminoimidazolecarboxamide formyltransferase/IMP cyclohydrolase